MAAPKGNKFASHDKPWTNALERVLKQLETGNVKAGEALRAIAEVTVIKAIEGDKDARKEIADRLDGKATEYVNITHRKDARELTDADLADIAAGSSNRTSETPGSEEKPTSIH